MSSLNHVSRGHTLPEDVHNSHKSTFVVFACNSEISVTRGLRTSVRIAVSGETEEDTVFHLRHTVGNNNEK